MEQSFAIAVFVVRIFQDRREERGDESERGTASWSTLAQLGFPFSPRLCLLLIIETQSTSREMPRKKAPTSLRTIRKVISKHARYKDDKVRKD